MDQKPISANGPHTGITPSENHYEFNKTMRPNIVASPEKATEGKQKIDWVRDIKIILSLVLFLVGISFFLVFSFSGFRILVLRAFCTTGLCATGHTKSISPVIWMAVLSHSSIHTEEIHYEIQAIARYPYPYSGHCF